jgi:MtN3 and saliva related transmembrane protein
MALVDILGAIGATLTTIAAIPQAIKVVKTQHTKDLSLAMYVMIFVGICFWLAYGIMLGQLPIIISNTLTLLPISVILGMKLREK